ncbi:MAG: sigma-70 family RNA polymerase sigma factor [Alphaproteobacteria bacterium]|nr:sigma-70 family RNA polymerase sigma factor [Alphaproteobacteria bacterium]
MSDGLMPLSAEQDVIVRLQRGDRAALGELYRWYGDRLFRQVILPRMPIRELAEDVLRDTFRLACERIAQFNLTNRSIWFWLRRIAINRAIDVHRAHQRQRRLEDKVEGELEHTMGSAPPAPDRRQQVIETRELVEEALAQLNPRYAQALRLRLLEDRDREECADILGVTVGNFDVILHRATKAFRQKYPPR